MGKPVLPCAENRTHTENPARKTPMRVKQVKVRVHRSNARSDARRSTADSSSVLGHLPESQLASVKPAEPVPGGCRRSDNPQRRNRQTNPDMQRIWLTALLSIVCTLGVACGPGSDGHSNATGGLGGASATQEQTTTVSGGTGNVNGSTCTEGSGSTDCSGNVGNGQGGGSQTMPAAPAAGQAGSEDPPNDENKTRTLEPCCESGITTLCLCVVGETCPGATGVMFFSDGTCCDPRDISNCADGP
ncbi:MAG TPA: hypothetical protein VFQ61_20270 [Polyangiaceae bacterium]|nr:hypothetical protein [Polyangiaceae bacterium]